MALIIIPASLYPTTLLGACVNYGRAMRGIATELRTAATTLDLAWKAATEACGHLEATIDALEDKLSELRSVRIMREEDR